MALCDQRGPLTRSGHTQPDREIAERDPAYFRLDERDVGDLILFARRFAAHVRYYDPANVAAGDWSAFFDTDIAAILASLAKVPVDPFRAALTDVERFLEDDPARAEAALRAHFSLAFHLPLTLYREVAARQAPLSGGDPLHRVLQGISARDIGPALAELARYHQGAVAAGLIGAQPLDPADYATLTTPGPGPRLSDQVAALVFTGESFGAMTLAQRAIADFAPTGWSDFYTSRPVDGSPYADAATVYGQIFDALNYNLLVSAMERVFQALARAKAAAQERLKEILSDFAAHTPHYGLWLAFLTMFDRARDELNCVTGRHLDFYYEEILRLARRAPVPDHVHLLVDLAKGREAHLLSAGTLVRAGKDDLGNAVVYGLDEDMVANRARVADLRAVRVDEWTVGGQPRATVRAAPVAASADGAGADLPEDAPHFAPFGPPGAPFARIGFAVADRQLFMREGKRKIVVTMPISTTAAPAAGLRARLSAEEGWLTLEAGPKLIATLTGGDLTLTIKLDGDDPPLIPFDPEVHDGPYPAVAPVLEVLLDFDAGDVAARLFAQLRDTTRGPPVITTTASGLRRMSIATDDGTADPAAGFKPFGTQPRAGSRWIIGSSEVFARKLEKLEIKIDWAETHTENSHFRRLPSSDYSITFDFLNAGAWASESPVTSELKIDNNINRIIRVRGESIAAPATELSLEDPPFSPTARNGYVRMTLKRDFGHAQYTDVKTLQLIEQAKLDAGATLPNPCGGNLTDLIFLDARDNQACNFNYEKGIPRQPYTPEITEISLEYASDPTPAARVWRLHPYGVEAADGDGRLLPDLPYAGALFVGVEALEPPARLALLAQVADGTGDPLLDAPELTHAYIAADAWTDFVNQDVDDRTDNLAGSGLLAYAVPQQASPAVALMPADLHWLRIAAPQNATAVNRLLSIDAQAVRATFVDRRNDPAFLESPLPAATIAKLKTPDIAVKGLRQPYASFGGRGREDQAAFRRRASERLRHKDRAVTMWDHEHIALEVFPAVYRVKCLNHTELVRQAGLVVGDNELAPGAVTVVAVPYTEGRDHLNALRPYTDRATISELKDMLAKRLSPFARLEVANPKFEEVHVALNVAFLPEIADTDFFRGELEAALIEHLTPWRRRGVAGVEFGGRIYKSTVVDFVEELPFVDYLEDVRLYHRPDPEIETWAPIDAEIVSPTTARSILVSAPTHEIGLIA